MEPSLPLDQLLRLLPLRLPGLGWFMGAGVSASGGIPTAWDMVWEFKREIYCTRERRSRASCDNLSDPALRRRIQTYLDEQPGYPKEDTEEEYSFYFEATYPDESDRRRYIDGAVRRGTPTYGHVVLALLMKAGKINAGFVTNFDGLLEDSWAKVNGSVSGLTVAHTGEPEKAFQAMSEGRYPLYAKLHGDFQSRKLKNIATELASQDVRLRHALVQYCRNNGLVVCGYSGRDASIMEALDDAIDEGHGYPNGLFWTYKAGTVPSDAVVRLIDAAACAGVKAALVEVDSFDDLMAGLAGVLPESAPQASIDAAGARPSRLSAPATPLTSQQGPVVRTNSLPFLRMPSTCRLIAEAYDRIVVAAGFDPAAEALRLLALPGDRADELEAGADRHLRLPLVEGNAHVPAMAALAQGPGFALLSCLGLTASRVLSAYVPPTEEAGACARPSFELPEPLWLAHQE